MMMMVICSMHSDYIDMGNDNDGKGEQQGHTNMSYFNYSKKIPPANLLGKHDYMAIKVKDNDDIMIRSSGWC